MTIEKPQDSVAPTGAASALSAGLGVRTMKKESDMTVFVGGITWVDQAWPEALPEDPRLRLRILAGRLRVHLGLCLGILSAPLAISAAMLLEVLRALVRAVTRNGELLWLERLAVAFAGRSFGPRFCVGTLQDAGHDLQGKADSSKTPNVQDNRASRPYREAPVDRRVGGQRS